MTAAWALATALTFIWLGMVVAISFLEAPLKFRATGVTVRIGLAIGRLVFRAFNAVEACLAVIILAAAFSQGPPPGVATPLVIAAAMLLAQLVAVRPRLNRRTRAVLAGEDAPRSRGHHAYIALELVKLGALIAGGIMLLGT
jgi:hypothetical protein